MNRDLGLKVLGQIMDWTDDRARQEFEWLKLMARLKYDGYRDWFLSGIGAALAGSMANKSSIVIDLRGWRTPSVSGEELQALGKSGPRYTAEIARGLPVPRG